jgi:nucleoside-diphosphate-sugar epimerase
MEQDGLHVVFGTGPLGLAVMRELRRRGLPVRMVNRSGRVDFPRDDRTQVGAADAADPARAREACEGAAAVYHCVGLPYPRWREFPAIARGIAAGASAAGATLVYGDNLYAWGHVQGTIREGLPENPTTVKGRIRAEVAGILREAHAAGRVRAAIGRASDFFGPGVTDASMLGSRVIGRLLQGKPAQVVGDPDRRHSYTWIEDFGRALVTLATDPRALGETWIVPTAPARTTREIVAMLAARIGARPALSAAPRWMLSLLGAFDGQVRELKELLYEFEDDFVADSSRFEATFGVTPTPLEQSLAATVDWYRART